MISIEASDPAVSQTSLQYLKGCRSVDDSAANISQLSLNQNEGQTSSVQLNMNLFVLVSHSEANLQIISRLVEVYANKVAIYRKVLMTFA
jgi:hypothetical protein